MSNVSRDELPADPRYSATPSTPDPSTVAGPKPAEQFPTSAAPPAAGLLIDSEATTRPVPARLGPRGLVDQVWLDATASRSRLLAVSAADGGVGRSTLVTALGGLLALASPAPVVAIDAVGRSWNGLADRMPSADSGSVADAVHALDLHPTGPVDIDGWARTGPTGLRALVAEPSTTGDRQPPALGQTLTVARALFPAHATVLLDLPIADTRRIWLALTQASVPVLVARATTDSLRHTMHLLTAMRRADLDTSRVVVVVTALNRSTPRAVRAVTRQLAGQVAALVTVPYDPALAAPEPVDVRRLRRPTRRALLHASAAVLKSSQDASPPAATSTLTPAAAGHHLEEVLP
ncbi:hypothetical protein [Actinoplanes sp. NPDC051859]|uniref:hypothetical protein n=1 Tax=Actinoplanes sp. NPDC051859 TaxID=3363909 RepID=UPI00379ACF1B